MALYLLLTLWASTGVALQLYFMELANPGLRLDLCQTGGREVEHSPLCGLQVAPPLPVVEPPAPPRPLARPLLRAEARPGYAPARPYLASPRAPPQA